MRRFTLTFTGPKEYRPKMNWFTGRVQNCLGEGVGRVGNSVYAEYLTKESVEEAVTATAELIGHDPEEFLVTES